MELLDRKNKVYAPPSKLVASDRYSDIRATYRAGIWNESHECTLRGVRIQKLNLRPSDNHVWCLFPDGRIMIVRESNIRAKKVNRYGGGIDVKTTEK